MTGLIRLIVLGLVLTAFAPSADAMTWPRALALAHAVFYQHNTNAFRQLQDASRQGDSAAQTALGMMYQYGKGVTPNLPRAVHWYQLAARQGYKPAIKGLRVLQQLQRTAHARSLQSPAAPAPAGAQRASAASPVHDQQQSVRNLQRFWTLYFQAAHARLVDFGAPALVQPVSFAAAHP